MIHKFYFILILILSFNFSDAQSKSNVQDIFKMHLFLNKKNILFRTMDNTIIKNDSLYNSFKSLINIKTKRLSLINSLEGLSNEDYEFYKVEDSDIKYNRKLIANESKFLSISCWMNGYYILAINIKTSQTYRLSGFEINDFLSFLNDFKENYLKTNLKKLKTSTFLKKYKVEELDFNCLFKGLTSKELNRKNYPCLKRCSEPIEIN